MTSNESHKMQELTLDGSGWATAEDFYAALLPALGAPEWHGHNLDALNDSLGAGDINAVNPPLRITIQGTYLMSADAEHVVRRFAELADALRDQGIDVEVETLP